MTVVTAFDRRDVPLKILVLSCNTGEGHNSAAAAMIEELNTRGAQTERVDPISFFSERAKDFVSNFYNGMIRTTPTAFGVVYKACELYSATKFVSPVYISSSTSAQRLYAYIRDHHFDAVLCTHMFGMETMTVIRKRFNADIPCYGIFTDYTCYPFSYETRLDGLFVAKCGIIPDLLSQGIPESIIHETGIPVAKKFSTDVSQADARRHLGIPEDKPIYLVMSGGIGGGSTVGLCEALARSDEDFIAYVLIGRSEKTRYRLAEEFGADGRIRPVGFTTDVHLYMRAADVMLSKPGGLSSTEAASISIPLVHVNAIPGCETYNKTFFSSAGMSLPAKSTEEAAELAHMIVRDRNLAQRMREAQKRIINPRAAEEIADILLSDIEEKQSASL